MICLEGHAAPALRRTLRRNSHFRFFAAAALVANALLAAATSTLVGRIQINAGRRTLAARMAADDDAETTRRKPSRAALLLIDTQKAFTVGNWAQYFGGADQVADIERACAEIAQLLTSGQVPEHTPVLCTKCYLSGSQDEPYVDLLEPVLRGAECIHKPTMDVTCNPAFFPWLRRRVEQGVAVLVVGGCTTTSCVRVSSQQIVGQLAEHGLEGRVRVVVDLALCGARSDNFECTADKDPVLVQSYGREFCAGKSAVDLAVIQMRRAGVEVIERDAGGWSW
eukprot:TRINITY_DN24700_c0_g1_i1.p1 TRINITY_DN24700_c0_g1~~TRINITY_DN24700_c0_g1_i1.p1  ORF type:complete len:281 (-),score=43.31 TRINITY_DN24700_c0_g1_i1:61-903(-)